ncbi:hypothetical protein TNCV_4926871 [Trichonephila clavipes]|nr:hypothetical protein TNCV_4926871 [Trichonephila clavipes]
MKPANNAATKGWGSVRPCRPGAGPLRTPRNFSLAGPLKFAHGPRTPSDYSRGPNDSTLWPVSNDPAPVFRLHIWTLIHQAAIVLFNHFPAIHLGVSVHNQKGSVKCHSVGYIYVHYDFQSECRVGSEVKQ